MVETETKLKPDPAAELGAEPRDQTEQLRDKPPKKRGRPKKAEPKSPPLAGAALKQRSKVLERKLSELLSFPAVPVVMSSQDPFTQAYMLEHFTRSGPRTAAVLVEASESNPQLRVLLERITAGGNLLTVAVALAAYAAPPVMWTIGMRQQAARITEATTMDDEQLARMMAEAHARAADASQSSQPNGAAGAAPAPEPDSAEPEP